MSAIDGQASILDELGYNHDDRAAKKLRRTQSDLTQLPEHMWRQNQEPRKDGDRWYDVLTCMGCGLPASRYGLEIDHGVQWDKKTGEQVLPGGPGMADQGVCSVMSKTRDDARIAEKIGLPQDTSHPHFPPPGEWWGKCFQHWQRRTKCRDSCWPDHHRHLIRMADLVWGGDRWRKS